jgi:very-short-patch-repair endonuclease
MPEASEIRDHVRLAAEVATRLGGVVSRVSAAATWKWDVVALPSLPQVTVPRNHRLRDNLREQALVRRMDLDADQIHGLVTTRGRTLIDCLRWLDHADGLAVADSALRRGFSGAELGRLAAAAKGPRSVKVRRVAAKADRRSANVFESRLRAICLSVPGLQVVPQVPIDANGLVLGRPDLVDAELGLVVEADSFEWHGQRQALVEDARRYNGFCVAGWLVLRFSWEDVMLHPEMAYDILTRAVVAANARAVRAAG